MKLSEIKELHPKKIQPWMYQSKEEIQDWIENKAHIKGMIGKEYTIHCSETSTHISHFGIKGEDVLIQHDGKLVFPVQFEMAVEFDRAKILSLEGLPDSLEELQLPPISIKDLYEECPNLTALGFSNLEDSNPIPLLSIFKFKNMETFWTQKDESTNTGKAFTIINGYLKSNRNSRKCKRELEEAGLEEYAKT